MKLRKFGMKIRNRSEEELNKYIDFDRKMESRLINQQNTQGGRENWYSIKLSACDIRFELTKERFITTFDLSDRESEKILYDTRIEFSDIKNHSNSITLTTKGIEGLRHMEKIAHDIGVQIYDFIEDQVELNEMERKYTIN